MGDLTARLDLYLPGGGSTGLILPDETADIDQINENMRKIDDAVGARTYTSVTRPASPYDGQIIRESDTQRLAVFRLATVSWDYDGIYGTVGRGNRTIYYVANLTALDALSDAQDGDLAVVENPGTGITQDLSFIAIAGSGVGIDWRINDAVISDTKTNLDGFITAVAALVGTDIQFKVGGKAYVTGTLRTYRFTSIAGAMTARGGILKPGSAVLAGTGAAIGAVTVRADGAVTLLGGGTGATAVDIQISDFIDADYENYDVEVEVYGASGNTLLGLLLRNAGGDSAAGYDNVGAYGQNSVAGSAPALNQPVWVLGSGQFQDLSANLKRPGVNAQTSGLAVIGGTPNPMTAAAGIIQTHRLLHRSSFAATGITVRLAFSGVAATGLNVIIRVFGRDKG